MKCFFFKNVNMQPEILDSIKISNKDLHDKNILNVRIAKYVSISFWHTSNRATWAGRGHEGTGYTVANFYMIYVKVFDWKSAHLMQEML